MNLKTLLTFLSSLLLSFTTINAQYYKKDQSIDFIFGVDYGFRIISGNQNDDLIAAQIKNRRRLEMPKLNYRIGFNYNRGLNRRTSLKTGVRIHSAGFKTSTKVNDFDLTADINTIEKQIDRQGSRVKYNYLFIETPIGINYVYSKNWCKSFVEAGLSPSIYLGSMIRKEYEDSNEHIYKQEDINRLNLLGYISIGADMMINYDVSLFVQMVGRYQFNNLRKGELQEHIAALGMESGVRYTF